MIHVGRKMSYDDMQIPNSKKKQYQPKKSKDDIRVL